MGWGTFAPFSFSPSFFLGVLRVEVYVPYGEVYQLLIILSPSANQKISAPNVAHIGAHQIFLPLLPQSKYSLQCTSVSPIHTLVIAAYSFALPSAPLATASEPAVN